MADKSVIERLPEGTAILDRPAEAEENSVELALEAARLGASLALVRTIGGDEAVEILTNAEDETAPPS